MTETRNIYQRLLDVMGDVEYILKEDKKVNNQYTFVSHDAVTKKCRAALRRHGIYFESSVVEETCEWRQVKVTREVYDAQLRQKVTKEFESTVLFTKVKMSYKFVNADDRNDTTTGSFSYGYGLDNQDKGIGKAQSYAYKYALLKGLMLETGDDPERDINMFFDDKADDKKKTDIFLTASLFKAANEDIYQDLVGTRSYDDVKEVWIGHQDILKKIKEYCVIIGDMTCYEYLEKTKDEMKAKHKQIEDQKEYNRIHEFGN